MMDELSILEDASLEGASAAEASTSSFPKPDFTGSLDYIDSLASRRALALSRRDVASITTAINSFDYLAPVRAKAVPTDVDTSFQSSLDFRPLGDARRFNPEFSVLPPRALVRSSARVVSPSSSSLRQEFPPHWRNPLDPTRDPADIDRALRESERRISRKPFAFRKPDQVIICLKRKVRRQVFHALNLSGMHYFRHRPRRTFWSRVAC